MPNNEIPKPFSEKENEILALQTSYIQMLMESLNKHHSYYTGRQSDVRVTPLVYQATCAIEEFLVSKGLFEGSERTFLEGVANELDKDVELESNEVIKTFVGVVEFLGAVVGLQQRIANGNKVVEYGNEDHEKKVAVMIKPAVEKVNDIACVIDQAGIRSQLIDKSTEGARFSGGSVHFPSDTDYAAMVLRSLAVLSTKPQ